MSDRLTAAGAALLKGLSEDMQLNQADRASLSEYVARVEAEAAARAVDEALSVERVAEALDKLEVVGWVAMRYGRFNMAYYEKLAAALVAHLTKKEETHD